MARGVPLSHVWGRPGTLVAAPDGYPEWASVGVTGLNRIRHTCVRLVNTSRGFSGGGLEDLESPGGDTPTGHGAELEAVAAACGADDHPPVTFDDEPLVGRRREDTRLR